MPAPLPGHVPPPSPIPASSPGLTVETWINRAEAGTSGAETVLAQWEHTPNGQARRPEGDFHLFLRIDTERKSYPAFWVNTASGVVMATSSSPLALGTHHLAGTYDRKMVRLFVDGQQIASVPAKGLRLASPIPVTVGNMASGCAEFQGRVEHAALFAIALTPCQIAAKHLWHRLAEKYGHLPEIESDVYYVLDGRPSLSGKVRLPAESANPVILSVRDVAGSQLQWSKVIGSAEDDLAVEFAIPLAQLGGGYYRIEVRDAHGISAASYFALREDAPVPAGSIQRNYGAWVRAAVDQILASHTHCLPSPFEGANCVTTDLPARLSYRSLGYKKGRTFHTGKFPSQDFDYDTFRLDHEIWPVLDGLARISGESSYRQYVDDMLVILGQKGFDPRSGLLLFGEEGDLDVQRWEISTKTGPRSVPMFKPVNTGPRADMHLDRLWAALPAQTHRWLRATYYGHVTDAASMDFNRVTFYGFDDSLRQPAQARDASCCGFEGCAASLIHFWVSCWIKAGDHECLSWARRMTEKWQAVQHPKSGLVPNFFGAGAPGVSETQQPGNWAEPRNAALAAGLFLRTAADLRRHPGGGALAEDLDELGRKLALGVARYSYDPSQRIFREHLHLDGRPYEDTARYCFRTQADKDKMVELDPLMKEVPVFQGVGFYRHPNFYEPLAGSNIPYDLAGAALFCRDEALLESLRAMAATAVEEAFAVEGAFTPEARWTFRASGWYTEMCLRLFEATGDRRHLDQARRLADREISALESVRHPDWWRLRERSVWLDALLHLSQYDQS